MNLDRDEQDILGALDALDDEIETPDLLAGIARKRRGDTPQKPRPRRWALRPLTAVAAAAVLLGGAAIAASIGGLDWLRGSTEVPFAEVVEETELSVVSEGIKLSVIAKQSYADMSVLYVTLEDTEGLGRIDEDTQISLRWSDQLESFSYELLYFDSGAGIAAYQLRLGAQETFDGQTLSLGITEISYGIRDLGEIQMEFDLAGAVAEGENIGEPYADRTRVPSDMLTPGHVADIAGAQDAWVSAIGVLNGYLTVQTGYHAEGETFLSYDSLQVYLLDPDGNAVEPQPWGITSAVDEDMQNVSELSHVMYEYSQTYFDVDTENLAGYTLCYSGTTQELVRGDWTVELDFDSVTDVIEVTTDIQIDGVLIEDATVVLHPLGMTLTGDDYVILDTDEINTAYIETAEGEIELVFSFAAVASADPDGDYECVWYADTAIDIEAVTAITMGDNRIEIE